MSITDECIEWWGRISPAGYGRRGPHLAHRWSYETHVGPIPAGLELDHLCRNTTCINPDHLEPVTRAENNRRKEMHLGIGEYATHCVNGHEYTPENTYLRPAGSSGARDCRTCIAERVRRYKERKKNAA